MRVKACHSSDVIACSPFIGDRARASPGKSAAEGRTKSHETFIFAGRIIYAIEKIQHQYSRYFNHFIWSTS